LLVFGIAATISTTIITFADYSVFGSCNHLDLLAIRHLQSLRLFVRLLLLLTRSQCLDSHSVSSAVHTCSTYTIVLLLSHSLSQNHSHATPLSSLSSVSSAPFPKLVLTSHHTSICALNTRFDRFFVLTLCQSPQLLTTLSTSPMATQSAFPFDDHFTSRSSHHHHNHHRTSHDNNFDLNTAASLGDLKLVQNLLQTSSA
jgi:hypothetical protein